MAIDFAEEAKDPSQGRLTSVVVQQALDGVRAGTIGLETAMQWVADMAWAEGRDSTLAEDAAVQHGGTAGRLASSDRRRPTHSS